MSRQHEQNPSLCLVGVGNRFRGDDGWGPEMVSRLALRLPENVEIREASGEGGELLALFRERKALILFDAISSREHAPGTLMRFDANCEQVPRDTFHYSTHDFSVAEAIELGRVLGELPPLLWIYGVVGIEFGHGSGFSPIVVDSFEKAMAIVLTDIERWQRLRGPVEEGQS